MTTVEAHKQICGCIAEGFNLNGSGFDNLDGMSPLAQAEHIYAATEQFINTPKTMAVIRATTIVNLCLTALTVFANPVGMLDKLHSLTVKKNTDYGDSFYRLHTLFPDAIKVRLYDKASRLLSVAQNGVTEVNDEAWEDTAADYVNYCLLELAAMHRDDHDASTK